MIALAPSTPYSAWRGVRDAGQDSRRARGSRAGSRRRCRGTGSALAGRPTAATHLVRVACTGCRGRPRCRRSPRRSRPRCSEIQYGSRTRPSRRRSASISSGMRAWARTLGERSPTRASFAVGMPACSRARVDSRPTIVLWRRSAILMDPRLPAHVRGRRPAAVVLRARRASSATRSRRCPSTSPRWRPTSAPRCCTPPGGADRGGRAPARARRADPAAPGRGARRCRRVAAGPPGAATVGATPLSPCAPRGVARSLPR